MTITIERFNSKYIAFKRQLWGILRDKILNIRTGDWMNDGIVEEVAGMESAENLENYIKSKYPRAKIKYDHIGNMEIIHPL